MGGPSIQIQLLCLHWKFIYFFYFLEKSSVVILVFLKHNIRQNVVTGIISYRVQFDSNSLTFASQNKLMNTFKLPIPKTCFESLPSVPKTPRILTGQEKRLQIHSV